MADLVANRRTSLPSEEVIVRAVQFFSTAKWRPSSQSPRAATFDGRIPLPWIHMLLTILGFMLCVVPGLILYFLLIKKARQFQNLVVTASPVLGETAVSITYPPHSKSLVDKFMAALPEPKMVAT